ncbi:glycosyltransferase [Candidatus Uhrbacteria bacterium]|nr:glycosyltransferase [Candidatus Uhrbacteria bacterium]
MKILHVNKFFDYFGGAETYLHHVMEAQEAAGDEVHIFSTRSPSNVATPDEKYFVERMDLRKREAWWKELKKAKKFIWNKEAQRSFEQMLDDVQPDVIHLHNIYHHLSTSILPPIRKRKIPCVQTLHDYKLANPNYAMFADGKVCEHGKGGYYWSIVDHRCLHKGYLPNALAALEMYLSKDHQAYERTVQFFICPSQFMKKTMEEWGEPVKQLVQIPYAIDLPQDVAQGGGGYLLYAGRLSVEKGLAGFIQAAAQVPEQPIKIAGRGPQEAELKKLAKELKADHIEFLGFVEPSKLAGIRRQAEAVVMPTVSYENLSLALLEAMADGLPCLATKIGGNPELVEDSVNGFLVKPGDMDDWVHTLTRFFAVPQEVKREMGSVSRKKIIANNLWPQHLERLKECYHNAEKILRT